MNVTESFSMYATHSWLCGIVVMTLDWESVGCEFFERLTGKIRLSLGCPVVNELVIDRNC